MSILGIDVGASKIYYVVWDRWQRLAEREFKIQEQSKETFLSLCQKINSEIKKQNEQFSKVRIGVPETFKDSAVTAAANFPSLEGWDIKAELSKIFEAQVTVINGAKAFIVAETSLGAAKEMRNVVGLTSR